MKKLLTLIVVFMITGFTYGQGSINGKVVDNTGDPLIGASVFIDGTTTGTITDVDGNFSLKSMNGKVKLVVSYIGFTTKKVDVDVYGKTDVGTIVLESDAVMLSSIEVVASYAVERKTPVAFVSVEKKQIEKVLGSRDIPLMMNLTPSVYATEQGGGSGDARINVRGFNQRNVAIMINGVPVNDMENGWVYWSNWDGISDATSSIQLQRGLSAVNLATPSIGGTMNIVTSPADKKRGGAAKLEYGSGNFLKSTIGLNSGLINDKFAVSMSLVRKVGQGIVDKTWTDAWAYYVGASYKINNKHKLELFGMGAPQRHGQNLYKQNIAAYGHDFASTIKDYDTAAFDAFPEAKGISNNPSESRFYNENWNKVSPDYKGKQAVGSKTFDRHDPNYINERENFYHKPLVNLNWYADWTDKISQYTTVYWSGGIGGGSGTMGKMKYNYHVGVKSPSRIVAWDATIAQNIENGDGGSKGILRNSRNNQTTIGAISKFKINWNRNFNSTVGVDWRTAKIEHYREVRDLLGGSYFLNTADEFHPNQKVGLGEKVAYNFTNNVDWLGGFAQTEFNQGPFTAYGMVGYSVIKYDYTNHFKKDKNGKEFYLSTDFISGLQVKGGANYRLTENFNVYGNVGFVNKVPIFDAVISDRTNAKAADPKNEKFQAFELGANYFTADGKFKARLSGYYTSWKDRTKSIGVYDPTTEEDGLVFITGMDQLHKGLELDLKYAPVKLVQFGATVSVADWHNTNDVTGVFDPDVNGPKPEEKVNYYVDGLKIGDAPQSQYVGIVKLFPVKGLDISTIFSYYADFYADWDPFSRTNESDRAQSWKLPSYSLLDFHVNYELPIDSKIGVTVFAHLFNALDNIYISDATDNSKYNAYKLKDDNGKKYIVNPHKADAAEVFLGSPRKFNVGLKVTF